MIKQNLLQRLVAQLGQVLELSLALRADGRHQEALETTDKAFQEMIGMDATFIEGLPLKDLLALTKPAIDMDASRSLVISDLFYERAQTYEAVGQEERAYTTRIRSLTLLLDIFTRPGTVDLPDHLAKAEEMIDAFAEDDLPVETGIRLFRFFEKRGQYAAAEDLLFDMVESDEVGNEVFERGVAFYDRLLLKGDEELEAGGLPREEVREGLANLREARVSAEARRADDE